MSELAAARLAKELAQKTAQHENVVRDLSAAWSREATLVARIAELEAALREIADSYTSEMYDRPLAYKMSRIARKALRKSDN